MGVVWTVSTGLRVVLRNIGYGLGAQAWSALLGLAAMPLLVSCLGAEGYALLGLNLSVIMLAATGDLGVGRAVGKFIAEDPDRREKNDRYVAVGLALSLATGAAGAALLTALAPLVVEYVFGVAGADRAEAVAAFRATAAALPAVLLRILLTSALVSRAELGKLSAAGVVVDTLKTALAAAAAWAGAPLAWVVGAYGAAAYVHVALLAAAVYVGRGAIASPALLWDGAIARRLLGFGGWGTAATLAQQALVELDRWLVGALVSLEALGYYSIARDICLRQAYIPHNVLRAYFAAFSREALRDPESFGRTFRQAQAVLGLLSLSLGATLAALGEPLLAAWFGPESAARAGLAMAPLALGYAVAACGQGAAMAVTVAAARPAELAKLTLTTLAAYAVVGVTAMAAGGALAVAACFLSAQLGWGLLVERWVCRRIDGAPPLATLWLERAAMAAAAAAVAVAGGWALGPRIGGLGAALGVVGLTYAGAISAGAAALALVRRTTRRPSGEAERERRTGAGGASSRWEGPGGNRLVRTISKVS